MFWKAVTVICAGSGIALLIRYAVRELKKPTDSNKKS